MKELESFSILDVPDAVISRVARVVSATEKSGIRVDWLDCIIGEISSCQDHAALAKKEERLSIRVTELSEELGGAKQQLGEVRAEMVLRNFCPRPVPNGKIYIIADS